MIIVQVTKYYCKKDTFYTMKTSKVTQKWVMYQVGTCISIVNFSISSSRISTVSLNFSTRSTTGRQCKSNSQSNSHKKRKKNDSHTHTKKGMMLN